MKPIKNTKKCVNQVTEYLLPLMLVYHLTAQKHVAALIKSSANTFIRLY